MMHDPSKSTDEPLDSGEPASSELTVDHEIETPPPSRIRTVIIPAFAGLMLVGLLLLLAYALLAPDSGRRATQGRVNPVGVLVLEDPRPAPAFSIEDADGNVVSLDAFQGKIVLLNFWASWCRPCEAETPLLQASHDKLGDDVVLIGINVWDTESASNAFVEKHGVTYTHVRDTSGKVAVDYGVSGVPETFIINASGEIVGRFPGEVRKLSQLRSMVDEAR